MPIPHAVMFNLFVQALVHEAKEVASRAGVDVYGRSRFGSRSPRTPIFAGIWHIEPQLETTRGDNRWIHSPPETLGALHTTCTGSEESYSGQSDRSASCQCHYILRMS